MKEENTERQAQKYVVRWKEVHMTEVEAKDEESAFDTALKKNSKETLDSTDPPIAFAA